MSSRARSHLSENGNDQPERSWQAAAGSPHTALLYYNAWFHGTSQAGGRKRVPGSRRKTTRRPAEKVVQCNGTQRHRLPRTGNMEPGPPLTLGTEHRLGLGSQRFASLTEEQNRVNENSRDMFPSSLTHASCFASVRFHGCGSAFSPTARQKDRRVSRSQVSRSTGIISMDVISIP